MIETRVSICICIIICIILHMHLPTLPKKKSSVPPYSDVHDIVQQTAKNGAAKMLSPPFFCMIIPPPLFCFVLFYYLMSLKKKHLQNITDPKVHSNFKKKNIQACSLQKSLSGRIWVYAGLTGVLMVERICVH